MTVWFDVEDLVRYFLCASRPTGIQRLSFEVYRELSRLRCQETEIRFCRRGAGHSGYRSIHFPALEAGILAAASAATAGRPARSKSAFLAPLTGFGRSLPQPWRQPLGEIYRGLHQVSRGLRSLARAARQLTKKAAQRARIGGHQFDLEGAEVAFLPGDWFVVLGAAWELPYDPALLEKMRAAKVRYGVLVYDLIPELFPEWAIPATVGAFRPWLRQTVPAADAIFTISRNTATDLQKFFAASGKAIPAPVVLPVGSMAPASSTAAPPLSQPYVLFVSTIEVRKNHVLAFRVWRRLLQTLPAAQVPDLVFAGKMGWLMEDFSQQLENCAWLNGKIKFVQSPSEPELAALYRHCLFTLFPSFYEGWGLPVSESLTFGKVVAASNRSSIPEAGGKFCAYFNPDNLEEAYRVIAGMIKRPELVAEKETLIASGFNPPNWADTATAVLHHLESACSAGQPAEADPVAIAAGR